MTAMASRQISILGRDDLPPIPDDADAKRRRVATREIAPMQPPAPTTPFAETRDPATTRRLLAQEQRDRGQDNYSRSTEYLQELLFLCLTIQLANANASLATATIAVARSAEDDFPK